MKLDMTMLDTASVEGIGLRINLNDETGMPYPGPITALVAGTYSKVFRSAQFVTQDRAAKRTHVQGAENQDEDSRKLYAVAVLDWDLEINGKMAPPVTIFALKPHIYDQIVVAAHDHAAHFRANGDRKTAADQKQGVAEPEVTVG